MRPNPIHKYYDDFLCPLALRLFVLDHVLAVYRVSVPHTIPFLNLASHFSIRKPLPSGLKCFWNLRNKTKAVAGADICG